MPFPPGGAESNIAAGSLRRSSATASATRWSGAGRGGAPPSSPSTACEALRSGPGRPARALLLRFTPRLSSLECRPFCCPIRLAGETGSAFLGAPLARCSTAPFRAAAISRLCSERAQRSLAAVVEVGTGSGEGCGRMRRRLVSCLHRRQLVGRFRRSLIPGGVGTWFEP